ncbi:MAG: (2Fe-2S)-binding protein [Fluviibacter sp.]|jgi:bacterioferritin-associated ferredoxin
MYICICNAVTDKQLCHAINDGAGTMEDLHRLLSVGSQCGNCRDCARQYLRQHAAAGQPRQALALAA